MLSLPYHLYLSRQSFFPHQFFRFFFTIFYFSFPIIYFVLFSFLPLLLNKSSSLSHFIFYINLSHFLWLYVKINNLFLGQPHKNLTLWPVKGRVGILTFRSSDLLWVQGQSTGNRVQDREQGKEYRTGSRGAEYRTGHRE